MNAMAWMSLIGMVMSGISVGYALWDNSGQLAMAWGAATLWAFASFAKDLK